MHFTARQVLSANTEHVAQIESVHEDANLRMHVTRVELEKLVEDLAERIIAPFHQALRIANIDIALVSPGVCPSGFSSYERVSS